MRGWLGLNDVTARELARRSVDSRTEQKIHNSWMHELLQGTIARTPELWRIRALSAAMGVPERELAVLAAAQWLGLDSVAAPSAEHGECVPVPVGLSAQQRERFLRVVTDLAVCFD